MHKLKPLAIAVAALALLVLPAGAQAKDSDGDGMSNRFESRYHVANPNADPDGDNVDNRNEFRERTAPRDRDSNNDGQADGREDRDGDRLRNAAEDATGNDPIDKDTDDDGTRDGLEQAGVVSAYDESTGELTIDLSNGKSVTGAVTEATDVECLSEPTAEEEQGAGAGASLNPGGPGGGEHRGGEREPGSGERGQRGNCDDKGLEEECPEGTLAVGARVHEAELRVRSAGAEWVEIEILS